MQGPAIVRRLPRLIRVAAAAAATVTVLGAAQCADVTGQSSVAGEYTLSTVNGSALPFIIPGTGSDSVVVSAGTLSLLASGQYLVTGSGTLNGGQQEPLLGDGGSYTMSGSEITFQSADDPAVQYVAVRSDNALTVTVPGAIMGSTETSFTLLFQK